MSMIRVENLTFAYPSSYDNIFENVNFQIDTDWKLGFVGRNGRGKTTFLNLLLGKYEYHGKIQACAIWLLSISCERQKQINYGYSLGSLPAGGRVGAVERTILSGSPWWCTLEAIFYAFQWRADQGAACRSISEWWTLFTDWWTDKPFGYESQRNRFSIPETEKGIYPSLSWSLFFRWLCWPYPVDQSVKHRSAKRKFFYLVHQLPASTRIWTRSKCEAEKKHW